MQNTASSDGGGSSGSIPRELAQEEVRRQVQAALEAVGQKCQDPQVNQYEVERLGNMGCRKLEDDVVYRLVELG